VTWHPFHPLLVSGGSEGSIMHWDLTATETSGASGQTTTAPRATLAEAHDSNVWSLAFHPLGHLLVSASNDHTTRFWSRERPGDQTSVFSAGGEKPPGANAADTSTAMDEYDQDDNMMALPGMSIPGMNWSGQDQSFEASNNLPPIPIATSTENGFNRGGPGGPSVSGGGGGDDFIPGFGGPPGMSGGMSGSGGGGGGRDSFGRDFPMRDDRDRSRDNYDDDRDRDRDYDRRGGGGGGRGYRDRDDDWGRDRGGGRNGRWGGGEGGGGRGRRPRY
jgi:polyadenylation factor subunit 2